MRDAAAAGADVVVAVGGDGTVNEVVNGLDGYDTPLGVLPFGTANDFATGLGIPTDDVDACLRLAFEGRAVPIDIARANGRAFINASVGGFGAVTPAAGRRRGCASELMAEFVTDRDPQALDAECLQELSASPFFIDRNGPTP